MRDGGAPSKRRACRGPGGLRHAAASKHRLTPSSTKGEPTTSSPGFVGGLSTGENSGGQGSRGER